MIFIIGIGIPIIIIICVGIFIMQTYNKLVTRKNKVKNSWAHIDAQLQRRFDLIPNLVSIVKGAIAHEEMILEKMNSSIRQYTNAQTYKEKLIANEELTSYLKSLYVVANHYPELRANKHFLQLQTALTEIEEDITYARQFYNDAVTIYNNLLMTFPNNIVASMFNFKEEVPFDAIKEATMAPAIQFKIHNHSMCPTCGASVSENNTNCEYCGCSLTGK